tara:strand:+ start:1465 stop:2274 length:810 start_codon:yes stop_codon:yes gene_type:complete
MKKIIFFSGDNLRHKFIVDKLISDKYEIYWIITKRNKKITTKKKISHKLNKLLINHNNKRFLAEKKFFNKAGNLALKKVKKVFYINSQYEAEDLISKLLFKNVKMLLTYGCKKIDIEKIRKKNKFSCYYWNIHAGLSPWYRGTITHFWPSYMLEPEKTAMTLHEITQDIDWGPIIDQTKPILKKKDNLHELSCRAVYSFGKSLRKKIEFAIKSKKILRGIEQKSHGKIWTNNMWEPKHLILIYETHKDKIIKYCLKNKFVKKVKLKSIF